MTDIMDRRERGTLRGYIEILAHDLETDGGVINRQTMARYLRNALTRQDADAGWQPIETAPMDEKALEAASNAYNEATGLICIHKGLIAAIEAYEAAKQGDSQARNAALEEAAQMNAAVDMEGGTLADATNAIRALKGQD